MFIPFFHIENPFFYNVFVCGLCKELIHIRNPQLVAETLLHPPGNLSRFLNGHVIPSLCSENAQMDKRALDFYEFVVYNVGHKHTVNR